MKQVAFIGTGNMGGALIRAACQAIDPAQVLITDYQPEKAKALAEELGCALAASNDEAVLGAQYIFLCVKPQVLPGVLQALIPTLAQRVRDGVAPALISIAAGVTLATIRNDLGEVGADIPLLRVMPNTCAAIGKGMLALSAGAEVTDAQLQAVRQILSCAGRLEQLPESQMDAFTAVAGCGPAFVYQLIEALADGGVMAGLPRQQAQIYAAQTLMGAAAMVLESDQHPGELKDAVCSPGGSTIAGVATLERYRFRAAAIDAVMAAYAKNIELGKR